MVVPADLGVAMIDAYISLRFNLEDPSLYTLESLDLSFLID
jgi:hypothetical protein